MSYQLNKTKFLNKVELDHLQGLIEKYPCRDTLLIKLALSTGARASEILNIKLLDLDPINNTVFIKGLKDSNDREIPLKNTLFNALLTLSTGLSPQDHLFTIGYQRLAKIWNHYKPSQKSFKSLRHTFGLQLYERTKDILLVKAALGHKCLTNTMIYLEYSNQNELLKKLLDYGDIK